MLTQSAPTNQHTADGRARPPGGVTAQPEADVIPQRARLRQSPPVHARQQQSPAHAPCWRSLSAAHTRRMLAVRCFVCLHPDCRRQCVSPAEPAADLPSALARWSAHSGGFPAPKPGGHEGTRPLIQQRLAKPHSMVLRPALGACACASKPSKPLSPSVTHAPSPRHGGRRSRRGMSSHCHHRLPLRLSALLTLPPASRSARLVSPNCASSRVAPRMTRPSSNGSHAL